MRLLFLINIAAVALIGVIAGDYLFEQTYGWWATTNSVGIGSVQLPVHSSVGMMVMLSIPALIVALAVVDLVVIAVRTKKRNRTTMFLLASPAILVCGLGVILAEPGDLLSSGTVALLGPPKSSEQRLLEAARQGRTRTERLVQRRHSFPEAHQRTLGRRGVRPARCHASGHCSRRRRERSGMVRIHSTRARYFS